MKKAAFLPFIPLILLASCITAGLVQADQQDTSADGQVAAATKTKISADMKTGKNRAGKDVVKFTRDLLLEGAEYFLGTTEIAYLGRRFPYDCSGLIMGIYYYAGIDLQKMMKSYRGNAVSMMHQALSAKGLILEDGPPEPGDIIFWDNTYDYNGDGLWNDLLTHAGMVVSVSEWGAVEYIHLNYRKGIVIERMNLSEPDVNRKNIDGESVVVNSAMRMAGQPAGQGWLASHLFRDYGRGWK